MELRTARLKLRLITLEDLESIHILHSLPETDEYNTLGIPEDIEETKKIITPWVKDNEVKDIIDYTFAIEIIGNGFIGLLGLKIGAKKYSRGEVWYKIHSDYWNCGYATEAVKAIIGFGFKELKLHRIEAGCAVDNLASIKVLEKVGMKKEGRKRQVLPLKNGWSDGYDYAILKSDVATRT